MSIKEARSLLWKFAEKYTDNEIQLIIEFFSGVAKIFIEDAIEWRE